MNAGVSTLMDENTRRYYLDTMGIQCWQRVDAEESVHQPEPQQQVGEAVIPAVERLDWPSFEAAVKQCEQCALRASDRQPVTGTGNRSADLMFVLLAPAADDAFLTAEANALFVKMLAAINISIKEVYITSLLKCPVPVNHTISPKEVLSCRQHLQQQIRMVAPSQLVVLGETAARCLLQKNQSLDELRDIYNQSQQPLEDALLFLSYSPEELLLHAEDKRKAWADLQLLQALIAN
jgi:uracil-DNA glycosylase family 4